MMGASAPTIHLQREPLKDCHQHEYYPYLQERDYLRLD